MAVGIPDEVVALEKEKKESDALCQNEFWIQQRRTKKRNVLSLTTFLSR
jgi:hypothetical protein